MQTSNNICQLCNYIFDNKYTKKATISIRKIFFQIKQVNFK